MPIKILHLIDSGGLYGAEIMLLNLVDYRMTVSAIEEHSSYFTDNSVIQEALNILVSRIKQPETYITTVQRM